VVGPPPRRCARWPLLDGVGLPVPDALRSTFESLGEFEQIEELLTHAQRQIGDLADSTIQDPSPVFVPQPSSLRLRASVFVPQPADSGRACSVAGALADSRT
jgi:hypothetical protein